MRFALLDNKRVEAQPKLQGLCPNCKQAVIAKCGNDRIKHWAHKSKKHCDSWWESETEWHRNWKNQYPTDWQEFSFEDPNTSEKHIADIHTPHNLVIEFQHSFIDPEERTSRELFYKNMIWVVDGTRLKRDFPRFVKSTKNFKTTEKKGLFLVDYIDEVFPSNWLNSSVPVLFDFKGLEDLIDHSDIRYNLYCLFHVILGRYSILAEIPRDAFIRTTINGEWTTRSQNFIENLLSKKAQPIQNQNIQTNLVQRQSSYYYDPKKGKIVKKWRF